MTSKSRICSLLGGCALVAVAWAPAAAYAQAARPTSGADATTTEPSAPAAQKPAASKDVEEVVVTGTLIRGVAPVGTNVIEMPREAIIATGATSANDLLTRVPQVTSAFLSTPTTSVGDAGLSVVRPNLRNLGASGANTTLVLVDGHRMVGAGVLQTTADPDVIPPGVLQRVEILADGGSSIYGSDAIGGVINFITRSRFDGFEAAAHYGVADNYHTWDVNLTAGKDWGSGSAYISYAYAHNNAIFGRDRGFLRQVGPNNAHCTPGTVVANGATHALPNLVPGTTSTCDFTDNNSYWPATTRNTVFANLHQQLTENITLDIRGYYSRRRLNQYLDLTVSSPQDLRVTNANPFFRSVAGETSQTVQTTFAGVIDNRIHNTLESYGVTPSLTADLGGGWELRLMGNYGQSTTKVTQYTPNAAAVTAALASTDPATALNPYDITASPASVLAGLSSSSIASVQASRQKLENVRAVLDGSLFHLPGGDTKLAVGIEYTREGAGINQPPFNVGNYTRSISAVFGEVNLPIVGPDNRRPGVHALTLTVSARYDHYSDFGNTTNPKIGLNYEPVDWVRVRANWGKSFDAPSVIDRSGVQAAGFLPFPLVANQTAPGSVIVAGNPGTTGPQTADTWSVGIDIRPPAVPGKSVSATYYNIDLKNVISLLPGQPITSATSNYLRDRQTCADLPASVFTSIVFQIPITTICTAPLGGQSSQPVDPARPPLFSYLDWRVQNLGLIKQDGIDFNLTYRRPVSFGAVNLGLAGTYTLKRDQAVVPGAPFINQLSRPGASRLFFTASAGVEVGGLTATMSINHRQGYDLNPVITNTQFGSQGHVDAFTTVDFYLAYNLPQTLWKDATVTLNVQNAFDAQPPFYNGCIGTVLCGFTNGSTLGAFAQVGLRKKF